MAPFRRTALTALSALGVLCAVDDALAQQRYSLQVFHFNLQYVCGGTIGFAGDTKHPEVDQDNDETEDSIITESFAPVVDLFERHPTWGVDLEMQGYMLDVLAARHPGVLEQIRAMATSGQIDIVSFHYSDQLFLGYPQEDWERSQELTAATFETHGVPLSRSVFCQEGQAAPAMAAAMAERGYRNMVWPKNLWSFQHGDAEAAPLYTFGDIFMIQGGKGYAYDDGTTTIDLAWTFFNDGELLATGDQNPYFTEFFFHKPEEVAEYEAELADLEAQGYTITTVDKYVDAVSALVTPATPPPLLDGTWQPDSTGGIKRWLGGGGVRSSPAAGSHERDNHVRTVGAQAHRELAAAETIAAQTGVSRAPLDAAWRMLFLGQVTDASGINPYRGEIQYGIAHLTEAMRMARDVIHEGKDALGANFVTIDPASGDVSAADDDGLTGAATEAPLTLAIDGYGRPVEESWELIEPGHWRVVLRFGPGEYPGIKVTFPGELEDQLAVGLALDDATPTIVERSAFTFEEFHFALPTGYIGIGGGRFVIKDMGAVHVAAEVTRDAADVLFEDETASGDENHRWVFHLVEASAEDAAAMAIALNAKRRLVR